MNIILNNEKYKAITGTLRQNKKNSWNRGERESGRVSTKECFFLLLIYHCR